jgi:hypothetical protein
MNSSLRISAGLMIPFLSHAHVMADIAIDPRDVVPSPSPSPSPSPQDPFTSSQTQPEPRNPATESMTMIAGGLLLCAVVALAIVRLRNARQKALVTGSPASKG